MEQTKNEVPGGIQVARYFWRGNADCESLGNVLSVVVASLRLGGGESIMQRGEPDPKSQSSSSGSEWSVAMPTVESSTERKEVEVWHRGGDVGKGMRDILDLWFTGTFNLEGATGGRGTGQAKVDLDELSNKHRIAARTYGRGGQQGTEIETMLAFLVVGSLIYLFSSLHSLPPPVEAPDLRADLRADQPTNRPADRTSALSARCAFSRGANAGRGCRSIELTGGDPSTWSLEAWYDRLTLSGTLPPLLAEMWKMEALVPANKSNCRPRRRDAARESRQPSVCSDGDDAHQSREHSQHADNHFPPGILRIPTTYADNHFPLASCASRQRSPTKLTDLHHEPPPHRLSLLPRGRGVGVAAGNTSSGSPPPGSFFSMFVPATGHRPCLPRTGSYAPIPAIFYSCDCHILPAQLRNPRTCAMELVTSCLGTTSPTDNNLPHQTNTIENADAALGSQERADAALVEPEQRRAPTEIPPHTPHIRTASDANAKAPGPHSEPPHTHLAFHCSVDQVLRCAGSPWRREQHRTVPLVTAERCTGPRDNGRTRTAMDGNRVFWGFMPEKIPESDTLRPWKASASRESLARAVSPHWAFQLPNSRLKEIKYWPVARTQETHPYIGKFVK
ncbi:unnamed protein product [Diplocarpon coronariae]